MSFTLTELLELSREVENRLIEAGGEFTPELEEMTTTLDLSIPDKIDSYAVVIDRMEANAGWFKAQALKYATIQKGLERASENIRARLKETMIRENMKELPGNIECFRLSRARPTLVFTDKNAIPAQFLIEERVIKTNNDAIRAVLDEGRAIDGCAYEPSFSLRRVIRK